jgi:hypothetical protein
MPQVREVDFRAGSAPATPADSIAGTGPSPRELNP